MMRRLTRELSNTWSRVRHFDMSPPPTLSSNTHLHTFFRHANLVPCDVLREYDTKLADEQQGAEVRNAKRHLNKRRKQFSYNFKKAFGYLVEDWLFLALLGTLMAVLSMAMDLVIDLLQTGHSQLVNVVYVITNANTMASYAAWTLYTVTLVFLSASFVHFIAPQAIGSGIPEMKTILRGVILKEYLTGRTLISKMVGLTLALGSGIPIGKEGPFVHIASILANLLSYFVKTFHGIYANESRSSEMLAAACAVGVSSTFSAPVGGVLFSIEVTSVYFAVRNYWRGFFASACSATLFRLFRVYLKDTEVTVVAFYQTYFPQEAFFPEEISAFAFVGIICGLLAATFVAVHRSMVLFLRRNRFAKSIFQKHWMIYPIGVSFFVASITYPRGFGIFLAGEKKFSTTAQDFFKNCTWAIEPSNPLIMATLAIKSDSIKHNLNLTNSVAELNETILFPYIKSNSMDILRAQHAYISRASALVCPRALLNTWCGAHGPFVNLACFIFIYFFLSALMSTLPIPCGLFGPSFILGAGIGRLVGELMAIWYVEGIRGIDEIPIYPGVYAVVGAAAFCGGVTRTISVAVIIFELTGQLLYILPVMISVLIANAVCSYLQPSIYDSIIRLKNLPYLPDIPQTSSNYHEVRVEQFMTRHVRFLSRESTYAHALDLLHNYPHLKAFPIIENKENMILIGSCSRTKLLRALNAQVGPEARQRDAKTRLRAAIRCTDERLRSHTTNCVRKFSEAYSRENITPFTENSADARGIAAGQGGKTFTITSVSPSSSFFSLDAKEKIKLDNTPLTEINKLHKSISSHQMYRRRGGVCAEGSSKIIGLSESTNMNNGNEDENEEIESGNVDKKCPKEIIYLENSSKMEEVIDSKVKESKELDNNDKIINERIMKMEKTLDSLKKSNFQNNELSTYEISSECNINLATIPKHINNQLKSSKSLSAFTLTTRARNNSDSPNSMHATASDNALIHSRSRQRSNSERNMYLTPTDTQYASTDLHSTLGAVFRSLTRLSFGRLQKSTLVSSFEEADADLYGEERESWERARLAERINFDIVGVDSAPFQLVEYSSLFKIHSLFSLLGLSRAYVTKCGCLVGVVALRDLRVAVEKVHNGHLLPLSITSESIDVEKGPFPSAMALSGGVCASDKRLISTAPTCSSVTKQANTRIVNDDQILADKDTSDEEDMRNDLLTPCPEVLQLTDNGVNPLERKRTTFNALNPWKRISTKSCTPRFDDIGETRASLSSATKMDLKASFGC